MNKLITLIFLLFLGVNLIAQQSFTLEQATEYAIQNNNQLKLEQNAVQEAEGNILEYKSIGIPKLNGSVSYKYFPDIPTVIFPDFISPAIDGKLVGYSLIDPSQVPPPSSAGQPAQFGTSNDLTAGLELQALLFDGSFFVGLEAQKLYRDLVAKQAKVPELDIKMNVQKAFLAVLIAQRNRETFVKNISNLENTLRETSAIYENGFVEKLDVDRLELSLNNLQLELNKIDRLIQLSYNLLKFQMSYPIDQPIIAEGNLDAMMVANDLGEVVKEELNISQRPEYEVILVGEELADLGIKNVKAGYLPNVVGFASYSQQLQRNDLFDKNDNPWFTISVVGATLNLPIFDGFEKKAKMQKAKLEVEKVAIQKAEFERSVSLEVQNAKTAFLNAVQTVEITKKSQELAEEIYRVSQIKYKEGVGSSLELTQAERELYAAQSASTNALYEVLVAKTDLDKALGKL